MAGYQQPRRLTAAGRKCARGLINWTRGSERDLQQTWRSSLGLIPLGGGAGSSGRSRGIELFVVGLARGSRGDPSGYLKGSMSCVTWVYAWMDTRKFWSLLTRWVSNILILLGIQFHI